MYSGVGPVQGVDFALDPNGDGREPESDAVDVIRMSLGTVYGMREDDLSEASANATRSGCRRRHIRRQFRQIDPTSSAHPAARRN